MLLSFRTKRLELPCLYHKCDACSSSFNPCNPSIIRLSCKLSCYLRNRVIPVNNNGSLFLFSSKLLRSHKWELEGSHTLNYLLPRVRLIFTEMDITCLYTLLNRYIQAAGIDVSSNLMFFRSLHFVKSNASHTLRSTGTSIPVLGK